MNNQNEQKIPITLNIRVGLKEEFKKLQHIHGRTFTDALEAGTEACICLAHSPGTIKRKIRQTELDLHHLFQQYEIAKAKKDDSR
jgi:hypothetical protein